MGQKNYYKSLLKGRRREVHQLIVQSGLNDAYEDDFFAGQRGNRETPLTIELNALETSEANRVKFERRLVRAGYNFDRGRADDDENAIIYTIDF